MFVGGSVGDRAGSAVSGGADVDLDGYDDFLVGAPGRDADAGDEGAAYLILGPMTGSHEHYLNLWLGRLAVVPAVAGGTLVAWPDRSGAAVTWSRSF